MSSGGQYLEAVEGGELVQFRAHGEVVRNRSLCWRIASGEKENVKDKCKYLWTT